MTPIPAPFDQSYDLCAIGNVCIDIVATVSDEFLAAHALTKSQNTRILPHEAEVLLADLPEAIKLPGGVGANVAHVVQALGGSSIFQGIGGNDDHADFFEEDMKAHGISTQIARVPYHETSQVFCLGSPDGDRSFASYDGALRTFKSAHLDLDIIKGSAVTYLDSYMMLSPDAPQAFQQAIATSHDAGRMTCLNPCDVHTVINMHPKAMRELADSVTMLICNLGEAQALFGHYSLEGMATMLASKYIAGAITDGEHGARVFGSGQSVFIPPADVSNLATIDSNGAGDHFAAGFLYGFTRHMTLEQAGKLGQLCALDCLAHPGARPLGDLQHLVSALTKI